MARKKTVSNLTDALSCARKVRSGKACTMAELKASLLIMQSAYQSVKNAKRDSDSRIGFLQKLIENLR